MHLTKHHNVKRWGEMEVSHHALFNSVLDRMVHFQKIVLTYIRNTVTSGVFIPAVNKPNIKGYNLILRVEKI